MDPLSICVSVLTIAGAGSGAYKLGIRLAKAQDEIQEIFLDLYILIEQLRKLAQIVDSLPKVPSSD